VGALVARAVNQGGYFSTDPVSGKYGYAILAVNNRGISG